MRNPFKTDRTEPTPFEIITGRSDVNMESIIEFEELVVRKADSAFGNLSEFFIQLERDFRLFSHFAIQDPDFFRALGNALNRLTERINFKGRLVKENQKANDVSNKAKEGDAAETGKSEQKVKGK